MSEVITQICLTVSAKELETIERTLFLYGAYSITLKDVAGTPLLEHTLGETPLWKSIAVTALFDASCNAEQVKQKLSEDLKRVVSIESQLLQEQEWAQTYTRDFSPMRFGERLWIYPSWHEIPDPCAVNVLLDPGLAFGTGAHPTTDLCLQWLEANLPENAKVVDYGCGSGVLAIAAVKLGAKHVSAIDVDPQALTATRDNARRNRIPADTLETLNPQSVCDSRADVVLANILFNTLIDLRPTLSAMLRPKGQLVLSGVLQHQVDRLTREYAKDFHLRTPRTKQGWALIEGEKNLSNQCLDSRG